MGHGFKVLRAPDSAGTKKGTRGRLIGPQGLCLPCALGRSGAVFIKREGDGGTPRARLRVLYGFYNPRHRARPLTRLAFTPVTARDGWCDSAQHPAYNRRVRLPFAASHETLTRKDALYDAVLVLDWNISRRARGAGSAIFMHVARPGYQPTEGCIALTARDLARVLALLRRADRIDTRTL